MIDHIVGGEFMNVTSHKGATPYISQTNIPMVGAVSYDSASQHIKVYDGHVWQTVGGGSAIVSLTPNAIATLKWAEKKMLEEQELNALCDKHPAIKDLVGQMKTSMDNYIHKIEMIKTLLKEEEKIATS